MVSYIVKGRSPQARHRLASLSAGELACISAITEGELLFGLARVGASVQRRRSLELLLQRLRVEPWDREAAAAYGALRAHQEAIGKNLGPLDMQIAAHAVAMGATLITNDHAFQSVTNLPGLQNWAVDL